MKIVCISDTHGKHDKMTIPDGDILLHAGDVSKRGKEKEVKKFNQWFSRLPHKHKVLIAGNHDFLFENNPERAKSLLDTDIIYLENEAVEVEGLTIWGSPVTPWFFDWAFNRERGDVLRRYWDLIPEHTDILITHGPPLGILDKTLHGKAVGCEELAKAVERVKPKIHLFGHIHEDYGSVEKENTTFVNASMLGADYKSIHEAIVVEL